MKGIKLLAALVTVLNFSTSFANNVHLKCRISENIEVDTNLSGKLNKMAKDLQEEQKSEEFGKIFISQFIKGSLEIDYITRIKSFSAWSGTSKEVEVTGTFEDSEISKYQIETSVLDENDNLTMTITFPSDNYYKPSAIKTVTLSANDNVIEVTNKFSSENDHRGYFSPMSMGIEKMTYSQKVRCER